VARSRIKSVCVAIEGDRPISPDIAALESLIQSGQLTVGSIAA
jgi:histidine ammonia-lyase